MKTQMAENILAQLACQNTKNYSPVKLTTMYACLFF